MTADPAQDGARDAARDARVAAAARAKARPRAHALIFIAACFLASAAARVSGVGEEALAQARDARNDAQMQLAQAHPPEPTVLRPDAPKAVERTLADRANECAADPGPLLQALREQIAQLEAREARAAERERLLQVAEARVKQEIARLEQTEAKLAETLAMADGAAERDVEHLVGVYENMKPKNAAAIFDSMDPGFAAGFLSRMREDAAAGILAAMSRETAYAVTAVMAGQNVGAGKRPN